MLNRRGSGKQIRIGKLELIEENIFAYVDATILAQALVTLVTWRIGQKDTFLRAWLNFVLVIWAKQRKARTPEDLQKFIVRIPIVNEFVRSGISNGGRRKTIYKIGGSEERVIPKF